jgi:hypothetical protein
LEFATASSWSLWNNRSPTGAVPPVEETRVVHCKVLFVKPSRMRVACPKWPVIRPNFLQPRGQ